jgi:enamine deaminase RidA (YjgF/YER057c/UK114 family)
MRAEFVSRALLLGIVAAGALAGCAAGGGQQTVGPAPFPIESDGSELIAREYLNPDELGEASGFSHAVRHGRVLYISGELPVDRHGNLLGGSDRQAQLKAAFENLRTLLKAASSSPADVLRLNVYLIDHTSTDWDLLRTVAPDFFPARNAPAVTLLGVAQLAKEGALVAVDATALMTGLVKPPSARRDVRR